MNVTDVEQLYSLVKIAKEKQNKLKRQVTTLEDMLYEEDAYHVFIFDEDETTFQRPILVVGEDNARRMVETHWDRLGIDGVWEDDDMRYISLNEPLGVESIGYIERLGKPNEGRV